MWVKVGLELFLAEGASLPRRLQEQGYSVFLDLKLHDIPNTVAGAIRAVLPLEPALLTVHASGGPAMLRAAADAVHGTGTKLLAVTVLTSMDQEQLAATGVADTALEQVKRLAGLSAECGVTGLVCSPLEAGALRAMLPEAHLVTPGIRPSGVEVGNQQRIAMPVEALRAGANQLVVGRPITAAENPGLVYRRILHEIAQA